MPATATKQRRWRHYFITGLRARIYDISPECNYPAAPAAAQLRRGTAVMR
jgi:hypothetical protein